MAGRYEDEYERDDGRSEGYGRGPDSERGRWKGSEDRSFGRDRVFGERDTGVGYNRPREANWQERDYQGVSPAMGRGEYDSGYRANPGGAQHGPTPRGHDEGGRFGSQEADERYARAMRRPAPGGTGGYDYERGYGDGGRGPEGEGLEDRAREAGDFFRRTGQRITSWFNDVAGEVRNEGDRDQRSHRGRGPKGYKRSDERINDDAHQQLTDDHWLDASEISLVVSGGEATLSGVVDSRAAKRRAEQIVEDISGVDHVQNNLRIKQAGSYTPAGSGSGSVGNGGYGAGPSGGNLREEGDAANSTSANARNKT